jgi:hypothetical protein
LEEEAVEGVRNAEDGTKQAWDACDAAVSESKPACEWTPTIDTAMGGETPRKVLGAGRQRAGRARETLEGNEAHERMNPWRKLWGTAVKENRAGEPETVTSWREQATQQA